MGIQTTSFGATSKGEQAHLYSIYVSAINTNVPEFKKPILEANTPFHSETWYKFSTRS